MRAHLYTFDNNYNLPHTKKRLTKNINLICKGEELTFITRRNSYAAYGYAAYADNSNDFEKWQGF